MSMNLACNKIDLIQTPTDITYMLMVDENGHINFELRGKKAARVLYQYIYWAEHYFEGEEFLPHHIEMVKEALKNTRDLKVYIE